MRLLKLLVVLVLLAAGAAGLAVALSPRARDAAERLWWEIRAAPVGTVIKDAKDGDDVIVEGRVTGELKAPFTTRAIFTLKDPTGSIKVVTEENAPQTGSGVLVRGHVDREMGRLAEAITGGIVIKADRIFVTEPLPTL